MNELIFKIALGLVIPAQILIRAPFQQRYKQTHREADKEAAGSYEKALLTVFALFLFVPQILWLFTHLLDFADMHLPDILRLAGIVITGLSLVYFYYAHKLLGDNWSPTLETTEQQQLIVTGVYKYVRHPMYSSQLFIVIGTSLITGNWIFTLFSFLSFLSLALGRVANEEQLMVNKFGSQYTGYMQRTKRYIPYLL